MPRSPPHRRHLSALAAGGLAGLSWTPLSNLKVLDGTGHMRLNPQTNRQEKVGGVKYTIVYDAPKLLAEVAAAVAAEKHTVTSTAAQQ